jgi:hypothetical protein
VTGFNGVSEQIAERLPQQHIVGIHLSELAGDDDLPPSCVMSCLRSSAARCTRAERSYVASDNCVGRAKFRKFVTT